MFKKSKYNCEYCKHNGGNYPFCTDDHYPSSLSDFIPSSGLSFTRPLNHTFNLPSGNALYDSNDETITITKSDLEALSKNSKTKTLEERIAVLEYRLEQLEKLNK